MLLGGWADTLIIYYLILLVFYTTNSFLFLFHVKTVLDNGNKESLLSILLLLCLLFKFFY